MVEIVVTSTFTVRVMSFGVPFILICSESSNLCGQLVQELELRYAIPLGFLNAAINVGVAGGVILPWGPNCQSKTTPISDRFFMGGHTSLLGNMKGPSALLGFRTRGVGPSEARQPLHNVQTSPEPPSSPTREERPRVRDTLGGDLAVSGFADLSFDLPVRAWRGWGIHAHTFICAGNLVSLTGDAPAFSANTFLDTFRASCGAGLVFPTRLFRLEVSAHSLNPVLEYYET